jgi:hypothetical protein
MSDTLDYLSFSEPSTVGSSRQFLTQSYEQFSSDGADRFYLPGQSTRIEISGMSQNSFILPRTMKLVYHAVSNSQTAQTDPGHSPANVVDLANISGIRALPGTPYYGAPHIGSIQSEVPGLSSNMSALSSDGQSQRWYAQRLICSGDEGGCLVPGYKASFGQKGRARAAGGRDLQARADGVTGSFWRTSYNTSGVSTVVRDYHLGGMQKYDVPASAFLDLADGCSSALPLPYLTSSSSNLLVRVNWATVPNAVVTNAKANAAEVVTYAVGGVSIQWTAVNIIDGPILASIQSLFRGEVALPISEQLSVPVPMTLSHRAFRFSTSTLPTPTGSFSIRVPAGKAACNAVMLKIEGNYTPDGITTGAALADRYLVSPKPILRNVVLRVGSARYPAREISDVSAATASGLGAKWALVTTAPADTENDVVGGSTFIPTSDATACEMYKQGRQFFSFFDNDKYDAVVGEELFESAQGPSSASQKFAQGGSAWGLTAQSVWNSGKYGYANAPSLTSKSLGSSSVGDDGSDQASPSLFIFNLQSLLPEMSLRERGYAISAVDLRSQCDVIIEGEILGTAPPGVNLLSTTGVLTWPACTSWDITTAMSYTENATLLPSRTDLEASASLIPSAAGSISSAGQM